MLMQLERRLDINLGELQKTLDKQGLEIVENQKENMVGRKKLAEQTRGELSSPEYCESEHGIDAGGL